MRRSSTAVRWAAYQLRLGGLSLPQPLASEQSAVTFPTTHLVTKVRVALGADLSADPLTWPWQDITDDVRQDLGISLSTGRREADGQVSTGAGMLKLNNRASKYTRRNPTGPYYGLLSKNTPIWVTVDAGSGEKDRLQMFVNEWPVRWSDKSATDSTVTIRCAGVLRRIAQGEAFKSPARRATFASRPVEYFPMEDQADSSRLASALTRATLAVSGSVDIESDSTLAGSQPVPLFSSDETGMAQGPVVTFTSTGFWAISTWVRFPSPVSTDTFMRFIDITVSGSDQNYWEFSAFGTTTGTPGFQVSSLEGAGFFLDAASFFPTPDPYDGDWHNVQVWVTQNGSNIDGALYVDGSLEASQTVAGTIGQPTYIRHNPRSTGTAAAVSCAIGHTSIHSSSTGLTGLYQAGVGYVGEQAHERMARLCDEESIVFETGAPSSPAMGPQGLGTLLSLLRECEAVGGGVLYEKRWGLAYQSLAERYNAPVSMALDLDQGHIAEPPEPADDDQRTRNVWTASRSSGGSEYTAELNAGPMGTGIEGPGRYDDSTSLNVETDNQLSSQAGWRVHIGTVDEDRWPLLELNFARSPSLIDTFTALSYGARMTVSNTTPQMPPDDLDLVIEGHAEAWDPFTWRAALNCSPASAYRVVMVGATDGNLGRVDGTSSTLAADATSSDTTISVASTGALWRTGTVNFDIGVAGEQMTVTNISGGSSPQVFTVTRSVNGVIKAQPSTVGGRSVKVSLWKPAVYAL